jgi:thiol-disulfide isomerase/thioredoxin
MARYTSVLIAFAACFTSLVAIADDMLNIGDAPPPLALSSWIKGEKIDNFDPHKTYVVEFWATWCGPCKASIPHLTELAHQYKDKGIQFIGVDIWEDDAKLVQPFVDEMGEKMDYSIALDTVAENAKSRDGTMAKTWMAAAYEEGIPTVFVIRDGRIAWIGDPMDLDDPLEKITSDRWDLAEMAKKRLTDKEVERKFMTAANKIRTPYSAKDYQATLAAIDEVVKDNPDLEDKFIGYKFASLCNGGDIDAGLEVGRQMLEKFNDNAGALNSKFWDVIDPDRVDQVDPRVAQLALKAAQRAVELTNERVPYILDTLAETQFRTDDPAAAVITEQKAIDLMQGPYKDRHDAIFDLKQFTDHLDRYRKAAHGKK